MVDSPTPLVAIDAVALDVEATGLDVRSASLVEIGAVRIVGGILRAEESYRSLVRPLTRIDPAATRVHGIDDEQVRNAPSFQDVWPEYAEFAGGAVTVGHAVGFDLAIIERQLASLGLTWRRPRLLDTRLLAQLVSVELGGLSLDDLAVQFEIEVEGRHSALGDAMLAGKVFLALLPGLRRAGIWTLEECETACRTLTSSLDDYRRANWVEPVAPSAPVSAVTAPGRRDLFAYRHRVVDVMSAPPSFLGPGTSLGEALSYLLDKRISSTFVAIDADVPYAGRAGIVTERDMLRAFSVHQSRAFGMRLADLTAKPLITVSAKAFVYLAVARMRRHRIRHLAVVDEQDRIVGAVSARDLLRMHGEPAILVGDEISEADSIQEISKAWAKLRLAVSMMLSDLTAREITGLISQTICETTARAAWLAERTLAERGLGPAPCSYAVVVLGSAGRGESLLAADQDNALVFQSGDPDGPEDRWFAALGSELADILDTVGIPYCPGGVMAKSAAWRGSVATWEARIGNWIDRSSPADLLSVDIFFDLRPVLGDATLALSLWRNAFERAQHNASFAKLLVDASATHMAKGLTWFGRFNTCNGRIDLKRTGSFGLVALARALAIRHNVIERSTVARLSGLKAKAIGHDVDLDRFTRALDLFVETLLKQQIKDIGQGLQPTNGVAVATLSRYEREELRKALSVIEYVDEVARDLLF